MPKIELSTNDLRHPSVWHKSANGNSVCDFNGLKLTVFRSGAVFKWSIKWEDGTTFSDCSFHSQEYALGNLIALLDAHYAECERDAERDRKREEKERIWVAFVRSNLDELLEVETLALNGYEETGDREFLEVATRCRETIDRVCAAQDGELY